MNSVNAKHVHRFIGRNYSTIPAAPGVKHATTGKTNLLGLSLPELSDLITKSTAAKPFVAKQLYTWIYKSKVYNFEQMTNLSKELRGYLTENHGVTLAKIHKLQKSTDGTIKFLFGFSADNAGTSEKPNKIVETVYIPEENRATLCVSSQYGCSLNCKFCHTGTQKFQGNLTPLEIVGQILTAENYLINNTDSPLNNANKPVISNIVFMGQGEPLMNFRNLKAAIGLLSDSGGISLSRKKITVSTSGIIKNVEKVAADLGVRLAISLHASNDKTRSLIMPINKVFGLEPLMESVRNFVKLSKCDKTKRVTFE
ncbi:Dual-specificity RNA methyltransferase RlmN [Zancudomyces culisetae]|uniref:Dual-specificity RNA methyltransferase RlmN n=1 Tax=Zancudomyces culisetae TaxID=1213189 RepID=A0A1R1PLM1_ZANCU|nr:Dual-specificity RNA methyltransferase RlmN [Zancudomyces culisetae]|eukprot:OMH81829.1 Dual-specificity RNA methyltransferase RlmN [Zancudomyces culisetae]